MMVFNLFGVDTLQSWTPEHRIIIVVTLFIWIQYIWELYLAIRQHSLIKRTTQVPKELDNVLSEETFQKARLYTLDKSYFSFIQESFSVLLTTVTILSGILAIFWTWSRDVLVNVNVNDVEDDPPGEILHSLIWLLLIQAVSTVINLPFTIYYTFVLEEKHGFNKQTAKFFIVDKLKAFVVTNVIVLPLAALIIVIIKNGGDYFFVWLWVFTGVVTLLLLTIYPAYIAPLFDKFTPLPEGELRQSIEALAQQLQFPLGQLYVIEGSKRSAHSNAYIFGLFGSKRIVLFDTLIGSADTPGCTNEQILAVLSHELGHWKFGHITKNLIITQINLLLVFGAFALIFKYEPLYTALGFQSDVRPVLVGLVAVLQFIFAPYNAILSFVLTALSRHFEFEADGFALKLGRGDELKEALIKLTKDNLGFPVYDHLYSSWHHSHPPLLQRIDKLNIISTTNNDKKLN